MKFSVADAFLAVLGIKSMSAGAQLGNHSPGVETDVTCHEVGNGDGTYRYTLRNLRDYNNRQCAIYAFEIHCTHRQMITRSCDSHQGGRCGINSIGRCPLFENLHFTCPQLKLEQPCRYYPQHNETLQQLSEIQASLNDTRYTLGRTPPSLVETWDTINETQAILDGTQKLFDAMQAMIGEMSGVVDETQTTYVEIKGSLNESDAAANTAKPTFVDRR